MSESVVSESVQSTIQDRDRSGHHAMTARWYAVHAYSNFENKVADSIKEQAKQRGLSSLFE